MQRRRISVAGIRIASSLAFLGLPFLACSPDKPHPVDPGEDVTDPVIGINAPADGTLDFAETWTFRGSSSDNVGVTQITWETAGRGSGTVTGNLADWSVQIPLELGDLRVSFTAWDAAGNTASDFVDISRTHYLRLSRPPVIRPQVVVSGGAVPFEAWAALAPESAASTPERSLESVDVVVVDSDGDVLSTLGELKDNGDPGNGDEIGGDNVFTFKGTAVFPTPGDIRLRLRASYESAGRALIEDFSAVLELQAVAAPSPATMQDAAGIGLDGDAYAQDRLDEGDDIGDVADQTVAYLNGRPHVAQAGASDNDYVIWYRTTAGLEGNIVLYPEGLRGGGAPSRSARGGHPLAGSYAWESPGDRLSQVASNRVLIYDAFASEFAPADEGPYLGELFRDSTCPAFEVDVLSDAQCTVDAAASFPDYGTLILVTHGGLHDGRVFFMTGESVGPASLQAHSAQYALGDLTLSTRGGVQYFSVLPGFIARLGGFAEAIIYNGSCRSAADESLADAFLAGGARAYLGFDLAVNSSFAQEISQAFFAPMVNELASSDEAFIAGQADPEAPHATFTLISLDAAEYEAELANGSFERGDLSGWSVAGDGRVITGLGSAGPSEGAFMGLIGTGLGGDEDSGALTASVCGSGTRQTQTLYFDWDFFSEEFLEFCESIFQDFFEVAIVIDGAETVLMHVSIQDLCDQVEPADVNFDVGEVYHTGWKHEAFVLPGLETGQSLLVSFRTGELIDGTYDTAVLIDNVSIQ